MTVWHDEDDPLDFGPGERDIEHAHSVVLTYCANCEQPHLYLKDDEGNLFALVTIEPAMGRELIEALGQLLKHGKDLPEYIQSDGTLASSH